MDDHAGQGIHAGRPVVVIGGGLAGISAAMELADHGYRVRLLEKRPYLGGRAYSFRDRSAGVDVDNGQHVFMKCCTAYIAMLRKLGVMARTYLQPRLNVRVFEGANASSSLYSVPLPGGLHLLPSLLRYKHLSFKDKIGIGRTALVMKRLADGQRDALDSVSFYDWLVQRGESDHAIDGFWNLVTLPTLNDDARDVSAAQAIMVLQAGFFRDAHGGDLGYATVGLSALLADEAQRYIEDRGGDVCLRANVERLEGGPEGVTGTRIHRQGSINAGAYVLAVPPRLLADLLPEALANHHFFARAAQLEMSPIVNVHVWFDRPVTDVVFAAYLGNECQWIFNQSAMQGSPDAEEQHLCVSISAAQKYIDMPKAQLQEFILAEMRCALPNMAKARVTRVIVVKEHFATFRPTPGSAINRLPARTPVPNLFLAGAWTNTGWPSTMESAVRSGVTAAQEVMAAA